jgi:SAM-dependent methyltransferase
VKKQLDASYWNNRYRNTETGWDTGGITTPLKEYFDQLQDKNIRILIPGAGNAYEAEYLHAKGFKNVFVCDVAKLPLQNFLKRCPSFDSNHLLHTDFFKLEGPFDLIIEQTFFCALHPMLRPEYFLKMKDLLSPGGRLVGLLFNDKLNIDKPPFGGRMDEYPAYFEDHFDVKKYEMCYNSIKPRAGREIFINLEKRQL